MPTKFPTPATEASSQHSIEHDLELPAASAGMRLDQALAQALPQYSRARLQAWLAAGEIEVDGRKPRARDAVLGGERVRIAAKLPATLTVSPETLPLAIVHADRAVIVVNKAAGRVVHPGAGNRSGTLQNALLAYDPKLATLPRAGLVHRIDKDTSGLLVVARTLTAHTALVAALAKHAIEREYLALVHGVLTGGGSVDAPIGRHRTDRLRMAVRPDGRPAITHYRIERRFGAHTLLRVRLETGRTHQIRVHLTHARYPIVGDPVYGGRRRIPAGASPNLLAALQAFRRQALHAAALRFAHPVSGKPLEFTAPLPADFAELLGVLGSESPAR